MRRKILGFALSATLLAIGFPAWAQQPTKVTPIGYLVQNSLSANAARIEAFRQGLRELSYVEGKNIVIEWRDRKSTRLNSSHLKLSRMPSSA